MEPAIQLDHVWKKINGKVIIKDVTLSMYPGEVFGLLGPNGAGKTTTIRMMVGLMKATEGTVKISGVNLQSDFEEAIKNIGAVVENPEMYGYLTGYQNLKHYQRMSIDVTNERLEEVIKLVGLEARIHEKVSTYSLGMRQRLGLAQALLHKPNVLILDEPTNGLDPAGIREIRDYLRRITVEEQICIVVSSHLLAEMEKMCDRIAIIQKGEIIQVDKIKDFMQATTNEWFIEIKPIEKAIKVINADDQTTTVKTFEEGLIIKLEKKNVPKLIEDLVSNGVSIFEVKAAKQKTLEDQFLTLTGGEDSETIQ
ncbi:ABC transporter ATP-binding protein [Salipaludibacillus sp. HK11]|uniref:ABC transporter ATP-binding protein n=1 Tax=Salipaludibacillus sp. HK11 TaxID=3394320 RepID=UPI0039FBCDBE